MEWNNEYSVQIEEIDDQHRILFDAITELERSILDPNPKQRWSNIHYAIVKLQDFVRIHFAVEEALMRIMHYPELAAHVAEHRGFVTYLMEAERRSVTQEVSEDEIVAYLRNWLNSHIKYVDNRYGQHFRRFFPLPAA